MPSTPPAASAAAPHARDPGSWQGPLLAIAGAIAFSGKAIIVKLGYRHTLDGGGPVLDAFTLVMLRMLVALPFFMALAWWGGRGKPPLNRRDLLAVSALGFSGYYLASTLDFLGLQYISASLERLILYVTPTVVLLLSQWLFGRRATRGQWLAMVLAYAGLLLVFGRELHFEGPRVALGAALVLASTLSYALYMIYSGEWVRRIGAQRLAGWASAVACVLCIAQFAALRPLGLVAAVPAPVWWLSLVNGTLCTVAPVLMVMMAIERIGSARAAQLGMVGPVATIVLGIVVLGEPLTAWLVAGTVCVLGSVAWLARLK